VEDIVFRNWLLFLTCHVFFDGPAAPQAELAALLSENTKIKEGTVAGKYDRTFFAL
jgi:hypothetical protein